MQTWKRLISLALVLAMVVCVLPAAALPASALPFGNFGDVWWEFDIETAVLYIGGTGHMPDFSDPYDDMLYEYEEYAWSEQGYGSSIHSLIIQSGILSIGTYVFHGLRNLTSVSIPNTVTEISSSAFGECEQLPSVVIPDSVASIGGRAFFDCKSLTAVSLGSGVTTIYDGAFEQCLKLPAVELPENLSVIGAYAFRHCDRLTAVRIPDSVTQIGSSCFANCSSLKRAEVGSNVSVLPAEVFQNCLSLEEVYLPEGLTTINSTAFQNTPALTDVYYGGNEEAWAQIDGASCIDPATVRIHYGVDQIDGHWTGTEQTPTCTQTGYVDKTCACGYTMEGETPALGHYVVNGVCTRCGAPGVNGDSFGNGLFWRYDQGTHTLTISGTGTMPDYYYFTDEYYYPEPAIPSPWYEAGLNYDIQRIVVEEGVRNIGAYAFCGIDNLFSVSLPNTVTTIGESVFYDCYRLPSVVIPDSVQSIGDKSFYNCHSLTAVTLGSGVTEIGSQAFYACWELTAIELPENLSAIGSGAFGWCEGLAGIRIPDSVVTLGTGVFYACRSLKRAEVGENILSLPYNTFGSCDQLEEVLLPEGLTSIASNAFYRASALTDVYYGGSAEAWAQIDGANYIDPTAVRIHCGVDQIDGHWTEVGDPPPTCLEPGFRSVTCPCGYTREAGTVAALGHDYAAVVTASTCTEAGYTTHTCSRCGDAYTDSETPALGHLPGEPVQESYVAPTVTTEGGYDTVTYCQRCDAELSREHTTLPVISLTIDPASTSIGAAAGSFDVTVTTSGGRPHVYREASADWLSFTMIGPETDEDLSPGVALYTVTVHYQANGGAARSTRVKFTCGDGADYQILPFTQAENILTLSETDLIFSSEGGTRTVSASATSGLPITVSSEENWITATVSEENDVMIAVSGNTSNVQRLGTVTVQCGEVTQEISVTLEPLAVEPDPIETSDLHVYSNISVGTDMVVNLTVRKNDLTNYGRFWIEVVKHEPEGDKIYLYGEGQPDGALTEKESTWNVPFTHIYAKEMGVNIDVRVYAEDANGQLWMSPIRNANIRDYLAGKLTATNNTVEQRVLCADMLNYGAAAQMFTGFQTDHLVNEELTEAQLAKLHEYETKDLPAVNKTNSNYRPEGASNILFNSVTLGNEVVLNLTVRLTEGTENVQVLVKDHATGAVVTTLDTTWSGSSIQASFSGIGADKMRTEFDFVTLVNGVETGNIRTWSVEAYVGEIRAGTLPLKTAMANALLAYGDSAAAYFAAQ